VYKTRVLVVDDLPDARATLSGLLSDEGYDVRSASSRAEALQVVDAERFHVAILDVRLDETDENNQDGLLLMHEVRKKDPTIAIIILTGHANVKMVQEALQPNREGVSPAFGFLEKSEADELVEYVSRALERTVRINTALGIQDSEQFLPQLPGKIRFVSTPKPPREQLVEEASELLRKLLFSCERIQIRPMQRGYSGAAVFEVIPWYRDRERGEVLVAKIGEHPLVDKEIAMYKDLVRGRVGGHRLPTALEDARTRSLSGILYTFAGLGSARDFATFYLHSDITVICPTLENLFLETCFPWRRSSGFVYHNSDLREAYMQLLRLDAGKLQMRLDNTMGGRHPFRKDNGAERIWLRDRIALVNPIAFALAANFHTDCSISTVHGDLNGYNVLVDHHNETWLIDFASTCQGPVLQDYASFETFLRLSLVTCEDHDLLYAWERALFDAPDLCRPTSLPDLTGMPEIAKAHQAVLTLRRLAMQECTEKFERPYLIGLLFNALKILTIMNLPPAQRDHALISAALVAERLQTGA